MGEANRVAQIDKSPSDTSVGLPAMVVRPQLPSPATQSSGPRHAAEVTRDLAMASTFAIEIRPSVRDRISSVNGAHMLKRRMKFHRLATAALFAIPLAAVPAASALADSPSPGPGHCTPPGYEIRFDAKEPGTPLAANGGWPPGRGVKTYCHP